MEAGLFILKALSNLSLVFLSLNLVFGVIGTVPPWHLLLFLGTNLLSLIVYYLKRGIARRGYAAVLWLAALILAFLPLPFLSWTGIIYALINNALAFYVGWSGIRLKRDYGLAADIFGKGLVLVVFIIVLLLAFGRTSLNRENFLSYIIIFLISSVNLLRTSRHLLYNNDERELRKINLRYSLSIISAALILGSPAVRGFLGAVFGRAYALLVGIIILLLTWLAVPLAYLLNLLVQGFKSLGWKGLTQFKDISGSPLPNPLLKSGGVNPDFFAKLQRFIEVPVKVLIIAVLLYGLFKLLRRFNDFGREAEEYRESRESIFSSGERTARLPKISGIFRPRNGVEAVRHYYRKFLHICLEREIEILPSDTSAEINRKSEAHFDKEALEGMRKIYIRIRYGMEACGEETVGNFRELFKRLGRGPGK